MSRQASSTVIGAFVVGALGLAVVTLLVLGGNRFFAKTDKYVMFFEGSAKGLSVGAPVDLKGVRVGSVADIKLIFDPKDLFFRIMVVIETDPQVLTQLESNGVVSTLPREVDGKPLMNFLVDKGLRAKLGMQSLVTGQLYVGLDFDGSKPARLIGLQKAYPELPTVASRLEQLSKTVEAIPLDKIVEKVVGALEGIERFVNSPESQQIMASINGAAKDAQVLLQNVNGRIEPLSTHADQMLVEARGLLQRVDGSINPMAAEIKAAAKEAKIMVSNLDKDLVPITAGVDATLKAAQSAVKQAETTLVAVNGLFDDNSATLSEFSQTLKELSAAARSIRYLADYLERHPEALLQGKGKEGSK
jgi:paraquat-inducible protein B